MYKQILQDVVPHCCRRLKQPFVVNAQQGPVVVGTISSHFRRQTQTAPSPSISPKSHTRQFSTRRSNLLDSNPSRREVGIHSQHRKYASITSTPQIPKPKSKMGAPSEARRIISHHPDKVRMLVLETDEPHPDTQREKGSFGEVMNELFQQAGEEHEPKLGIETLMMYVVEPEGGRIPDAEEIMSGWGKGFGRVEQDGNVSTEEKIQGNGVNGNDVDVGEDEGIHAILITGSMYDAHSDDEWVLKLVRLIQELWRKRPDIRFTGICFGHQILCRALGSEVRPQKNNEWELSHTRLTLNNIGRQLFNVPEPQEPYIHLHEMHLDHVVQAPQVNISNGLLKEDEKVHVWATSEHTEVQGVYIQKRLFTSQGHMEFDETMVKRQLDMRVESGALKKEDAKEAEERAEWMHDGLVVAKAVLRFFHGDDDKV